MTDVRRLALEILNKCERAEQYSNIALDTALKRNDLPPADRRLLTALVYGVIERRLTLDHWIDALSDRKGASIEPTVRDLLRMGLYQLAYLDRVPDHAAVNETVALAPKRSRGFVNAILRGFLRADKQIPWPSDPIARLSAEYSVLPSVCDTFVEAFGMERTEQILAGFARRAPISLSVNTLRTSREALMEQLRAAGIACEASRESRRGIRIEGGSVTELPGFDEGLFFVQDEASQLCVEALDAQADMSLLDVCACPGSKSFGAAIEMENRGRVIACDLHRNKLSLVESSARRLGLSIIATEVRDGRALREDWIAAFDRVLCDVPCSGYGVLAKKPEIRYKNPEACATLPDIQLAILENACRYVKKGGKLVYSTCTLLPKENGENVSRFLSKHPEFSLCRERTLYPDTDMTDGFYFAVLEREA